jgi:hypothetical protein
VIEGVREQPGGIADAENVDVFRRSAAELDVVARIVAHLLGELRIKGSDVTAPPIEGVSVFDHHVIVKPHLDIFSGHLV